MKHIKRKTGLLRLIYATALLIGLAANAQAQGNDGQYVIKMTLTGSSGDHYLAHVKVGDDWVLQDATTFSTNCLWYSGTSINLSGANHNYYFVDDEDNLHFLSAPLTAGGTLSLSNTKPPIYLLNNTDQNYYFYDWDSDNGPQGAGVARGHQYNGVGQSECNSMLNSESRGGGQCWEVYWVIYDASSSTWKLSSSSSYNIVENSGRVRLVTITEHTKEETPTSGGLTALSVPTEMVWGASAQTISATVSNYSYSYTPTYTTYSFGEENHSDHTLPTYTYHYYNSTFNLSEPSVQNSNNNAVSSYQWTLSGEGATYLTLSSETAASPTLSYSTQNSEGHKTATISLTVTFADGSSQTLSQDVIVKTPCQNPEQAATPEVSYFGVKVSWHPTADSYKVYWSNDDWGTSSSATVGNVTSYIIEELDYETTYKYKVAAFCESVEQPSPTEYTFTTLDTPNGLIYGSVYGGGRMADVTGKTEVVIVNCDTIKAIYGGNDIAGTVNGTDGSIIVLGVNSGDSYATPYGTTNATIPIGDVYGGGNGYYLYNTNDFVGATSADLTLPDGTSVKEINNNIVWTNETGDNYVSNLPKISKTSITVVNDFVRVDSIFGGAKNAFITNTDPDANGTNITVYGGTVYAVFGGNNYGGLQTNGKHHIAVNATTTNLTPAIHNTATTGYGRTFGIRYLFGGGNRVNGLTTDILISGGQCDTVFAGGNAADVSAANVVINCLLGAKTSDHSYGAILTNAIDPEKYSGIISEDVFKSSYPWDCSGIYNVRSLFGGNNQAAMTGLPTITLTSGSVGTVYGGGNSGQMLAQISDDPDPVNSPGVGPIASDFGSVYLESGPQPIYYSTHVVTNSNNMLVDYIYGGCQKSDVRYSTWVEVKNGHIGTVYGGCNISGDVGSLPRIGYYNGITADQYQLVNGGTYVKATGGVIHGNLFAGSNGFYHCNNGVSFIGEPFIADQNYLGEEIPTHNETHVIVSKDETAGTSATVKGSVYAGGNMAYVGFINSTARGYTYRTFVGFCAVIMDGGRVEGSVYGGGNRASVFGSNKVLVSGGIIGYNSNDEPTGGALYGGNDRAGQVAQITNRLMPDNYSKASDGKTDLNLLGVKTYVGINGKPKVNTVYGGGNGAYDYTDPSQHYCDVTDQPVQSNTFVDINIDAAGGSASGGYIETVYGGGNGVTVLDRINVLVNIQNAPTGNDAYDQIKTLFGGNNKGDLAILSDIIFLHGQVNTVYGGCNEGAMTGSTTYDGYDNIGSLVRLRGEYDGDNDGLDIVTPTAKVTNAIYGGCRKNGVNNNTLVLVEGGDHTATIYGGSDISGDVSGTAKVVVTGGHLGKIFGGGNGYYTYNISNHEVHTIGADPVLVAENVDHAPYCTNTQIDMLGGTVGATGVGNKGYIFGGGYGHDTKVTENVLINFGADNNTPSQYPLLIGDLYGGSALGTVNTSSSDNTTINLFNGEITGPDISSNNLSDNTYGNVYGGGLGRKADGVNPAVEATVNGKVYINVGKNAEPSDLLEGAVTLVNCNIFGCNNQNGSPQDDVFINVYATAHTDGSNNKPNNTYNGNDYAILQVFGGGNEADYAPEANNPNSSKKTHVYVHGCDNTISYVYGGGNAADAVGVETVVEGGHFKEVFGGGNGAVSPANIGLGGIGLNVLAGKITYYYAGSNKKGNSAGGNREADPLTCHRNCNQLIVESFFFGDNEAEHYGDIVHIIECSDAGDYNYNKLYAGSRWATVYGDIKLTVCGGIIENLFGGSMGYSLDGIAAHVRRFPTAAEIAANPGKYSTELRAYVEAHPELVGHGGNIELTITGGTIGHVFGGCDELGNIEGKITVIIDDAGNTDCPLRIGNIYGASNLTNYLPWDDAANGIYYDPTGAHASEVIPTPKIIVLKGSTGLSYDFDLSGGDPDPDEILPGDIFGGANHGNIVSNPLVIIGDGSTGDDATRVEIGGSVYGGGNQGDVTGNPEVVVVPKTHKLTFNNSPAGGTFTVKYPRGSNVITLDTVGERVVLNITATPVPTTQDGGYVFDTWTVTGHGASVGKTNSGSTTFTMGDADATLSASFTYHTARQLSIVANPVASGTFKVNGNNYTDPVWVAETGIASIQATPASSAYAFHQWSVTSGSGTVSNANAASTTFTMGVGENVTLTANFVPTHTLTLVSAGDGSGRIRVNGAIYETPILVPEGATVEIDATPLTGSSFSGWTATSGTIVHDASGATNQFIMPNSDATVTATFTRE